MKIVKVKCGDRSIPGWVVKTLKGTKKTAPYMFKAVTPDALDNLGDLAAWCQNNGSPASKVVNTGSGRFIKITDPLCRELELANLVKDAEDGEVLDTLDNLSRKNDGFNERRIRQLIDRINEINSFLKQNEHLVSNLTEQDKKSAGLLVTTIEASLSNCAAALKSWKKQVR